MPAKSVTLATTTLVEPTGAGRNIRDGIGNLVSSIIDQVYVRDLTGMGSFLEPYVISELDAKGGKVSTNAGKARTASSLSGLRRGQDQPLWAEHHELRRPQHLPPGAPRVLRQGLWHGAARDAPRDLRSDANGDGQASPDMYGIKNAKNTAGSAIFASVNVTAINENILDELFCLRQR